MNANPTSNYRPRSVPVWTLWFVACLLAGCETWINFSALPGLNWVLTTFVASIALVIFSGLATRPNPRIWLPLLLACVLAGGAAMTANRLMESLILHGNGITYARTAHQGFSELTLVASLCSALLIVLARSSAAPGRLRSLERILSVAIIVETQLLLGSAFHRMALYEGAELGSLTCNT
jgi:hypothetical protein